MPHAACAGTWNISGSYPDCTCSYACSQQPASNVSNTEPAPAVQPEAKPINITVSQMLDTGLAKLQNDFYRINTGTFTETAYQWMRIPANTNVGEITFDASPEGDVRFDNKTIKTIVASGFAVFKDNEDDSVQIYGLAVFKDKRTILDNYTGQDVFAVSYLPPTIAKKLRDCQVSSRDYYIAEGGDWFVSYSFRCWRIDNYYGN